MDPVSVIGLTASAITLLKTLDQGVLSRCRRGYERIWVRARRVSLLPGRFRL